MPPVHTNFILSRGCGSGKARHKLPGRPPPPPRCALDVCRGMLHGPRVTRRCCVLSIWGRHQYSPIGPETRAVLGLRWTFASFEGRRSFFIFISSALAPPSGAAALSQPQTWPDHGISALGNSQLAQSLADHPHVAPKAQAATRRGYPTPPNEKRNGSLRNPLILEILWAGILTTATSPMPCQSRRREPITCLLRACFFLNRPWRRARIDRVLVRSGH